MLTIHITDSAGRERTMALRGDGVIGRSAQNEIRLDSWRVAPEHARLVDTPAGALLEDLGAFAGTSVNGQRIESQYGPLQATDVVGIGPFKLRVMKDDAAPIAQAKPSATEKMVAMPRTIPREMVHEVAHEVATVEPAEAVAAPPETRALFEWRKRLHARLLEAMDLRRHDVHRMSDEQLRHHTRTLIDDLLNDEPSLPPEIDRALLAKQVLDEAIGLGPLEELLADDSVTEIMLNRYDEIFVERKGLLQRHPLTFTGDAAVMGVIERIVAPLGRRIDESSPMIDARLKDGSRVNAIIPPLALKGPCVTIRKFAQRKLQAQDLVDFDAISPAMARFLGLCVKARKNIIVSGGTGSGKTTLLNILSNFIPAGERIITVEDAAELKLHHAHLVSLESRPSNVEGKGAVPIRDLVRNTLRMRPDRIVVGECRGAEALDMLQAMNTGHEGSLTTLHANTPRDALARLETMVLMAGMDLPLPAIREQIASAVDLIVQQSRFSCGARKVTSISEVTGIESGKLQLQELFRFSSQGYRAVDGANGTEGAGGKVHGFFTGCDIVPSFLDGLREGGTGVDLADFKSRGAVA
jgi:pilus assembly protein CpaF